MNLILHRGFTRLLHVYLAHGDVLVEMAGGGRNQSYGVYFTTFTGPTASRLAGHRRPDM
jgi:hypothetical protein